MPVWRAIIRAYLHGRYGWRKLTGRGAFGHNGARMVAYRLQPGDSPLKKALFDHHVKQFHDASCSVATVVSVVNAARARQGRSFAPIGQKDILEKVPTGHWKERMGPGGYRGRRGLPLGLLGEVVQSSLEAYAVAYRAVIAVQVPPKPKTSAVMETLWNRLNEFETMGDSLVIAHFDQGVFVPTLNIPHISPVGGFNAQTGDVLVLDVDPSLPCPYQIGFQTFCRGLSSNYHHVFRPFGYGSGGYVYVKLR